MFIFWSYRPSIESIVNTEKLGELLGNSIKCLNQIDFNWPNRIKVSGLKKLASSRNDENVDDDDMEWNADWREEERNQSEGTLCNHWLTMVLTCESLVVCTMPKNPDKMTRFAFDVKMSLHGEWVECLATTVPSRCRQTTEPLSLFLPLSLSLSIFRNPVNFIQIFVNQFHVWHYMLPC